MRKIAADRLGNLRPFLRKWESDRGDQGNEDTASLVICVLFVRLRYCRVVLYLSSDTHVVVYCCICH